MGILNDMLNTALTSGGDMTRLTSSFSAKEAATTLQPFVKREAPQTLLGNTIGRLGYFLEGAAKGFQTGFGNEWNRFTNNNIIATGYGLVGGIVSGVLGGLYTAVRGAVSGGKGVDEALDQINDINNPYRRNSVNLFESFESRLLNKDDIKNSLRAKGITDFESPAGKNYLDNTIYSMKQMETAILKQNTKKEMWDAWQFPQISSQATAKAYLELYVAANPPAKFGIITPLVRSPSFSSIETPAASSTTNSIAKGLGVSVSQMKTADIAPKPVVTAQAAAKEKTTSRQNAYEVSQSNTTEPAAEPERRTGLRR